MCFLIPGFLKLIFQRSSEHVLSSLQYEKRKITIRVWTPTCTTNLSDAHLVGKQGSSLPLLGSEFSPQLALNRSHRMRPGCQPLVHSWPLHSQHLLSQVFALPKTSETESSNPLRSFVATAILILLTFFPPPSLPTLSDFVNLKKEESLRTQLDSTFSVHLISLVSSSAFLAKPLVALPSTSFD